MERARVRGQRSGMALPLVLALVAVIGAFGAIAMLLSRGAAREVDGISAHMRAVAVGEMGFAAVTGRLNTTRWADRWFRDAPDSVKDVPAAGGTYTALVRDTPDPARPADPTDALALLGPRQADLLIVATFDRASVAMYWRLMVPDGSLDAVSRVIPTFFTFAPEGTRAAPVDLDPLTRLVNDQIAKRAVNRRPFEGKRKPLERAGGTGDVGAALGFTPRRPPLDSLDPMQPGAPRLDPPYIAAVGAGTPTAAPIPVSSPPAPPPPPALPAPPTSPAPPGAPPVAPPAGQTAGDIADKIREARTWTSSFRDCLSRAGAMTPPPPGLPDLATQVQLADMDLNAAEGLLQGSPTSNNLADSFGYFRSAEVTIQAVFRTFSAMAPDVPCAR